ncbi:MAG: 1,6-anhydro-N-acetylmuramyl-L-alanine amidase AmpD [Gammaproteobacteria bacterium]|nr:1,6-anhydro-N-acetylmuramyl-L-alanine amidase AmpD [Gammaproteobacteria bacterium]
MGGLNPGMRPLAIDGQGWVEGVRHVASPNCDARPPGAAVELIVVHSISLPAGQFGGADVERLFTNRLDTGQPGYASLAGLRVSAHLFIRRDGEIVQFVPFSARAWHAGVSYWQGRERVNDFSVGIELEGTDHGPFEETQYRALMDVTRALAAAYPAVDSTRLCGHSDIAPGRKTDPGPFFDWARYRAAVAAIRSPE